jgi:ABC-type multidrug transport system ATPase subunit
MQDDLLHSRLTVGETLSYAADLRMSPETTEDQRKDRVDYVMRLMGITHCRDVFVGDTRLKGISGAKAAFSGRGMRTL